ncbi:MAG: MBL fold metallo-hydrolase, partial [Thermodesulfobacteriota bacterium]
MEICPGIHLLRIPFVIPVSPEVHLERWVNMVLLYGRRVHLVDCGVAAGLPVIQSYLEAAGRCLDEVATLLHTHAHPDHIGASRPLHEATGCRVAMHAAEKAWLEDVDLQARQRPVPGFATL